MDSIHIWHIIDTVFPNSKKIKFSDTLRLIFNLPDKIDLKRNDDYVA